MGDHPGTGAPYYAMRFIHGETLRASIAKARQAPHGMTAAERRRLLSAFVSVCNAIAYAHARGVVHRDLKTDNVVLGEFGEVLVIDWGLAKVAGHDDEPALQVELSSDLSESETRQGVVLGTPVYMAPEQAAGRIDQIDSRTDVFGLGAILFEILTGEPPHERGRPVRDMLYQIASSPCRTPRDVDPTVPPALDAVCGKALRHAREERYTTATELVEDIELWLAGEPVSVYRESLQARAWRWARRHRTLVTTAAALLLTSVDPASAQTAYKASIQTLEGLGRSAIQQNITGYRLARVHNSLGEVLRKSGEIAAAEDQYRNAIELLKSNDPGPADAHSELARVDYSLGLLLLEDGRFEEAETLFNDSISSYKDLLSRTPEHREYRQGLARSFINLGMLERNMQQGAEAEAAYGQAIAILNGLLSKDNSSQEYRYELGTALSNLGNVRLSDPGRRSEAEQAYRDSLAQLEPLANDFPDTPLYLKELANATNGLGGLLFRSKRPDEAEPVWRKAIALFEQLMRVQPDVPEHESLAALTQHNLAYLLTTQNDFSGARALLESAKTLQQKSLAATPHHPQRREFLRSHCLTLADIYIHLQLHDQVREIIAELSAQPDVPAKDLYRAARYVAATIRPVQADRGMSAAERTAQTEQATEEALSLLERAVASGFSDREEIERQVDLDALRTTNRFEKLIKNVASQ